MVPFHSIPLTLFMHILSSSMCCAFAVRFLLREEEAEKTSDNTHTQCRSHEFDLIEEEKDVFSVSLSSFDV